MKRTLTLFILVMLSLPARAQWVNMGFGEQILAIGVHDTSFFISNLPQENGDPFFYRHAHPNDWIVDTTGLQGNITSFASLGQYFFAGGNGGAAYISSDNGISWTLNCGGPVASNGRYVFSGEGGYGIYRSRDSGTIWDSINRISANCFGTMGAYILASTSSSLYRSTDSGGTWNPVTTPISNISCFAAVGTAIYAANGTQLMVSTDSGAQWDTMNTNFTVSCLATNGTRLFAGGDSGVYLLDTNGMTWTAESDTGIFRGLSVTVLCVFDTLLLAEFTSIKYPHNLYERSIPQMTNTANSLVQTTPANDTLSIYPNPASGVVTVISGGTSIYSVSVMDVLGEDVLDMPNIRESNIALDLSRIPSGTYFFQIRTANGCVLRKVVINR